MSCNLATVQASACSGGIGKETNPIKLLQLAAQSLLTASPVGGDVDDVMARVCTSGIGRLTDPIALLRIWAQNLCMDSEPEPEVCPTVVLSGAGTASVNQTYTKSGDDYIGATNSNVRLVYNAGFNIYEIILNGTDLLYTQYGDPFPNDWSVNSGVAPGPSGICL